MVKEAGEQHAGLAMQRSLEISSFHEVVRTGVCLWGLRGDVRNANREDANTFMTFLL